MNNNICIVKLLKSLKLDYEILDKKYIVGFQKKELILVFVLWKGVSNQSRLSYSINSLSQRNIQGVSK